MEMWILVLFLSILGVSVFGQSPDPCTTYTLISERNRSTKFNVTLRYDQLLCDRLLQAGWYRFNDAEMPFNTCIKPYHCGTHIPLWIQGDMPSVQDNVVMRKACGDMTPDDNNCCDYSIEVVVKNCNSYFVYYLQPVAGCSMAYCAGDRNLCIEDKYSVTGFAPCVDAYPKLIQPPFLTNPVLSKSGFEFKCIVPYPKLANDAVFVIKWLLDNKTAPGIPPQTLTGIEREATLNGEFLEGNLNKDLTCSVVSTFADSHTGGATSPPLQSNSYWVGIKYSKTNVSLGVSSGTEEVTLTSTIPIVCRNSSSAHCDLSFMVTTNTENILLNTCILKLRPTDWNNATHKAETSFYASLAPHFHGSPSLHEVVHTNVIYQPGKEWNNLKMPPIQVGLSSRVPGSQCASTGDPHIRTFDSLKRFYDNYHTGQYTMVQEKHGSFRVDVRTYQEGNVAFNCAAGVREGNDVIVIDMCNGRYGETFPKIEIMNPSMFENKIEIVKDLSGNFYLIKLQSGAIVKVEAVKSKFLNIFINLPGKFANGVEGLCGNFDGVQDNDLMHIDGQVDAFTQQPYPFIESWSIPKGQSLFEKAEPLPTSSKNQNLCACNQLTKIQQCSPPTQIPSAKQLCVSCAPLPLIHPGTMTTIKPTPQPGTINIFTTTPYMPTYSSQPYIYPPPTVPPQRLPNISFPQATIICYDLLNRYPSARDCINTVYQLAFTDVLDMCVTDMTLTGDTDMALSALSTMMEGCGFHTLINTNSTNNTINETFILPPTAKVCPNACTGNGNCAEGICTCNTGFEGSDCSINSQQPPTVHEIPGGKTCDKSKEECYHPVVIGRNMRDNNTLCNISKVLTSSEQGSVLSSVSEQVEARFLSTHHVVCPLPKDKGSGEAIQKFVLNLKGTDGHSDGSKSEYTIYNSECVTCDDQHDCIAQPDACLIENHCYKPGDYDTVDFQGWCVPSKTNTQWTRENPSTLLPSQPSSSTSAPASTTKAPSVKDTRYYTAQGTGCGCYFEQVVTDNCACCQNFGCPCPAHNRHSCYDCMNDSMCDFNK